MHPRRRLLLPPESKFHYPLAFFQPVTAERKMTWSVSQTKKLVHVGILTSRGFSKSGPLQSILGLHPGNVSRDVPIGENPIKVSTFLNQFMNAGRNYPAMDFQTLGWVNVFKQQWWSSLILYVLELFTDNLMQLGLYKAVGATSFGDQH